MKGRTSYFEGGVKGRDRMIDDDRIMFYENPYYFNNLTLEEQQEVIEKDFLSKYRNKDEHAVVE